MTKAKHNYETDWIYDDGTRGMVIWGNDFKYPKSVLLQDGEKKKKKLNSLIQKKREKEKFKKKQADKQNKPIKESSGQEQAEKEHTVQAKTCKVIKHKRIPFAVDLENGSISMTSSLSLTPNTLQAFQQLLYCCGNDRNTVSQITKLVFGLLAGCFTRIICDALQDDEFEKSMLRAPIFAIHAGDRRWDVLKVITEAVVPTYSQAKSKKPPVSLRCNIPLVLCSLSQQTTTKAAGLQLRLRKRKKKKTFPLTLPAQYRDTAVLLYRTKFEKNIDPFISRNRWVTIILYASNWPDAVELNDKLLSNGQINWDKAAISCLTAHFVQWFATKKKKNQKRILRSAWKETASLLELHNTTRGTNKIWGIQRNWTLLILTTAILFSTFLETQDILSAQAAWWKAELKSLFLPECCAAPQSNVPLRERTIDYLRDSADILMELIRSLLSPKFSAHLLYVPPNELFDRTNPDDGNVYYAYLRIHMDKHRAPAYQAIQLRQDTLSLAGTKLLASQYDWPTIVTTLRKEKLDFVRSIGPESMPENLQERKEHKTYSALTFDIEKMKFLNDQQKSYLHYRLNGLTNDEAWAKATASASSVPVFSDNETALLSENLPQAKIEYTYENIDNFPLD